MITFDDADSGTGQCVIRLAGSGAEVQMDQPGLKHAEMADLLACKDSLIMIGEQPMPPYISELVYDGCHTLLLIPMVIDNYLAAVIMFAYSGQQSIGDEDRGLLRKYADRIDVALSNAHWEGRLYQQVHYDPLTGLPNRILLIDRLGQALTRARQDEGCAALFFIDIDRFKIINDSLGHSAGDHLLKSIAMNLVANIRDIDTVVRFGGDEFIIVIPDLKNDERALVSLQSYATKLLSIIHQDIDINGINLVPEASIGIAVYPQNGTDVEALIKNADAAMHSAKEQGRNQYSFYSPELNRETLQRLQLEQELRRAIDNGELRLFYQPKVSVDGRTLTGAEALVRWQHPQRGMISPDEFIALAEETGLIDDLSLWVLRSACLQMREWRNRGLAPVSVAINLSTCCFRGGEAVADMILRTLEECGLDGSALEIEITETALIADNVDTKAMLTMLKDAGVGIAIDDFGTGYSSLSYLHKLPINKIKIDQSFIMGIVDSQDSRAIVASTIALAHELRFDVVAEGVESAEVQALLSQWACDELQGFYFSKPLPVPEFEHFQRRYMDGRPVEPDEEQAADRSSSV
jgi:diguanylate cyclase (GGDEF)-like protein